jgi:hypothetical protein
MTLKTYHKISQGIPGGFLGFFKNTGAQRFIYLLLTLNSREATVRLFVYLPGGRTYLRLSPPLQLITHNLERYVYCLLSRIAKKCRKSKRKKNCLGDFQVDFVFQKLYHPLFCVANQAKIYFMSVTKNKQSNLKNVRKTPERPEVSRGHDLSN